MPRGALQDGGDRELQLDDAIRIRTSSSKRARPFAEIEKVVDRMSILFHSFHDIINVP